MINDNVYTRNAFMTCLQVLKRVLRDYFFNKNILTNKKTGSIICIRTSNTNNTSDTKSLNSVD